MPYYRDSFKDYERRKIDVHWTEEVWEEHLRKHPELIDREHTSILIREVITEPDIVMEGKRDDEVTLCYYKQISWHQGFIKYIKVVIGCERTHYYVKSIFQREALIEFAIQEKKYNQFKEIWRSQNSYL